MEPRIYLDNASTTPVLPEVVDLMADILRNDFGNPSSIHQHGRKARAIIENARRKVARSVNASLGEIFFTSSATEASNMSIKNAVTALGVKRIIYSSVEHHCVLHSVGYLQHAYDTESIPLTTDPLGSPDLQLLEQLLDEDDKKTLVCLMHGNNEIGTMTDIVEVGQICRKYGALFHCDAVQTLGKYKIDVQAANISFLSGSAHKFHGPKGTGFVYINNQNIIPPHIHGGSQERNMRSGTENVAGIAGLALALERASENMLSHYNHILVLRNEFKSLLLTNISGLSFNGNQDEHFMAHVLSVSFPPGPRADLLVMNLDIAGISASSGSACSSGVEEDSHVLKAIGHPPDRKAIRFSFSPFNTREEIRRTADTLKDLCSHKP